MNGYFNFIVATRDLKTELSGFFGDVIIWTIIVAILAMIVGIVFFIMERLRKPAEQELPQHRVKVVDDNVPIVAVWGRP